MAAGGFDIEERLRRYAAAFRREAKPPMSLPESLVAGLGNPARPRGFLAGVPALAAAAILVLGGFGIAFTALELHNLGRPSAKTPIVVPTATPSSTVSPPISPSPPATMSPTATPTATPGPSGAEPGYVPGLAAIQMVGQHLGWAAGAHGIYATTDGSHWSKQYSSDDQFVGVDFISASTGWVVGTHSLVGTTDGGRSWHQLGEAAQWIRSVHFVSATTGWGIAGGSEPFAVRGVLIPGSGAALVATTDGGATWRNLRGPGDPQTVCFSDASHGWLTTAEGDLYRSADGGHSWARSLQMPGYQQGLPASSRVECAASSSAWVQWAPGGAAAGSSPYVVYSTSNGQAWRAVLAEPMTMGNEAPGVPAGPGSYPGAFSVVDPLDAVFVGDTPPANRATCMIATNGGATLKTTGSIPGPSETYDAAFISTSTGWVVTADTNGNIVIDATSDGGYHWSTQLSVPR